MTGIPAPIVGSDYRVTFRQVPGRIEGAMLARVTGRFSAPALLATYRVLVRHARGRVLSVIADTRAAEAYLDFAAYEAVTRLITAQGIERLNLVVCETDPGRAYVVKFGNEVAGLGGLAVHSRFVADLDAALAALAELMAEEAGDALPGGRTGEPGA